ncbi:MAG: type II toxin-antitoxin system VapB family antitoxin [Sphingorhabdus sp.]
MRTNIVIDDRLMRDALKATGAPTKRAVVEMGLQALVRQAKQQAIRKFRGRIDLKADLDAMRHDA